MSVGWSLTLMILIHLSYIVYKEENSIKKGFTEKDVRKMGFMWLFAFSYLVISLGFKIIDLIKY